MNPVILKNRVVRREDSAATRHAAAVARGDNPEVKLITVDGTVRALEVLCSCGATTVVELDVATKASPVANPVGRGAQ